MHEVWFAWQVWNDEEVYMAIHQNFTVPVYFTGVTIYNNLLSNAGLNGEMWRPITIKKDNKIKVILEKKNVSIFIISGITWQTFWGRKKSGKQ